MALGCESRTVGLDEAIVVESGGCGTEDRWVALKSGGPQFKSSHVPFPAQFIYVCLHF